MIIKLIVRSVAVVVEGAAGRRRRGAGGCAFLCFEFAFGHLGRLDCVCCGPKNSFHVCIFSHDRFLFRSSLPNGLAWGRRRCDFPFSFLRL